MINTAYSPLLSDREKDSLTSLDLYDRVINLKIHSQKGTFVLRSDFELVEKKTGLPCIYVEGQINENDYYIRKAQYKPSIKVQYKRVTSGVVIGVDIYINNFYSFNDSGEIGMSFNNKDNPITEVEFTMGYFGQFAAPYKYSGGVPTVKEFGNFKAEFGVDLMKINVLYVTNDKMPPDSVFHIRGEVGNAYGNDIGDIKQSAFDLAREGFKFEDFLNSPVVTKVYNVPKPEGAAGKTFIEELLYTHITKRFLRNERADKDKVVAEKQNGFYALTDAEAEEYGIKIYCSKGVKNTSYSIVNLPKDKDDKEVEATIYFNSGRGAVNTFKNIQSAVGNNIYRADLGSGNWIVFTKEEAADVRKLSTSFTDLEGKNFFFNNTLPAVNSISDNGEMVTIVSPFFFFINPFQTVYFNSRYMITNLVDYFTSSVEKGLASFHVINQLISFATVDNVNEMTLTCVSVYDNEGGIR